MSARAELACRVLCDIAHGNLVSVYDAIQLRNWAISTEDVTRPLVEIARGILDQDQGQNDAKRIGAEFVMTDLELAFTFLNIAQTSRVAATAQRNQRHARTAYDAVLRFLPRSLSALSATERESIDGKMCELKNRLEHLGETFKTSN